MEPFTTLNPYSQTLQKAERLTEIVGLPPILFAPLAPAVAVNLVEEAAKAYDAQSSAIRELRETSAEIRSNIAALENYTSLNIDMEALKGCEFLHYRFGLLSDLNFRRFEKFLAADRRIFFIPTKRDANFAHGIYFTPLPHKDEIDAIFASLNWEETFTPLTSLDDLRNELWSIETKIAELEEVTLEEICGAGKLAIACAKVKNLYAAFDVKKFASISRGRRVFTFFGWMDEAEATALEVEIENDDMVLFTRHGTESDAQPPTLLRNVSIVRHFEFFTRLYGLPSYGEIDPTPILAITYTLLFGLMFGDIGHGAALAVLGIFIHRKHENLGGIMTVAGISAALFGVLYGSAFGIEFAPLWRRPATNITETLLFAVILGAGLIAMSMLINMYNCLRRKKIAELLFGANGFAGLFFYSAVLWLGFRMFVQGLPLTPLVGFVAALPLVLICFKHPLENFLAGQNFFPSKNFAGFAGNIAVELFETLLTYVTNTISFVRVGAFAVSHAGMMHVVIQLSQSSAGAESILILVAGNVLVMVIEGLLIGIQVLRLDFYEIFSRFYTGGGKPFKSSNYTRIEG